eukprot:Seg2768.2 transcript_id=Seg2768.2/GoldUCD/mRNA.D3Y31 product="hypothetical protein" protein_id=Seg2768.2/GoldUCD/D3Y31
MIAEQFADAARLTAAPEELKYVNFQHSKFDAIVSILKEGIEFKHFGGAKVAKDEGNELIALSVFKFLQQRVLNKDGLNSELASFSLCGPQMPWRNAWFQQTGNKYSNLLLSPDVAIGIISKAGCESTVAELLLENDDGQSMISEICSSLQKWKDVEKSAHFVVRCLETLVKSCPSEVSSSMQCLLMNTLECVLMKIDVEKRSKYLYPLKSLYQHKVLQALIALKELETIKISRDLSSLLKTSAVIIKHEIDTKISGNSFDKERRKVQQELQKIVSACASEGENQRKAQLLQSILNAGCEIDQKDSEMETFNLGCNGFNMLDLLCLKFGLEHEENEKSEEQEDCLLSAKDLRRVVALHESLKAAKIHDFAAIFAQVEDVGYLHPLQIFQELLFDVESVAAKCVANEIVCSDFNNLLCLYATLVPEVEVLTMLITHLARVRLEGGHGIFGYEVFISNLRVKEASEVLMACQEYYASEDFKMKGAYDDNNAQFQEELNCILNSLTKSKFEEDSFNMLGRMCLHDPHAVLEELVNTAANSTPQSKLVLAFLSRMPALLSLKSKGGQETAVISDILKAGAQLKRQNFETMAEFVKGLTQITGKMSSGCNVIISSMQILEFLVIAQLEKHVAQTEEDALSLTLVLYILQHLCNQEKLHFFEALDAGTVSTQLVKCALSVAIIMTTIEESAQGQFEHLRKSFEERDLMHSSIVGALQLLKSLNVDEASYQLFCRMLFSELTSLNWKYQFYFADILRIDHSGGAILSVPSVLKGVVSSQNNPTFKYFDNGIFSGPHGIWLALFKLSPVNQEVTESFLREHLKTTQPNVRNVLTAISLIMSESSKQSWNEILNLISKFVKLVDSKLFYDIGLQKFMAAPEIIQQTACEISLISHAVLVILKKCGKYDELIVTNALVNLHQFLVTKIKHCEELDADYSVKCLAVVYNYTAFLNDKVPSHYDCGLKMLMLNILELIVGKLHVKETVDDEVTYWSDKLNILKQSLT